MRLLVVTQYFWPENFRVNDLVEELVQRGHAVTVLTGYPNYPDGKIFPSFRSDPDQFMRYCGAEVVRVPLLPRGSGAFRLLLNYASFAIAGSLAGPWKLRGREFDAIFVFEPSPITVGLPAMVAKAIKRAPIAFWVLDLWPQTLRAVGAVRSGVVLWLVDRLVRAIYASSDRILAQSRSFVPHIASQVSDESKIVYFPSWAEPLPETGSAEPAPEVDYGPETFTIVFTGNVGEAQDFPAVLSAAELLREEPVRWVIVGDGRKLDWVRDEVARRGLDGKVLLVGRYPLERMPSFIHHADALLVSLRKDEVFAMTIPGKLQTYLAAGVPILAMLDGEGAEVVRRANAGVAVAAGDAEGLVVAVRALSAASPQELEAMGKNGQMFYAREFERDRLIGQLENLLAEIVSSSVRPRR
jgi:colanic acid biosynthesis glycosyl transferase WcaI